jgi:signal transduction histidine kinase
VVLERIPSDGGALLLIHAARTVEWLEHAMRSEGLTRLAAGLAHDIKNPLNAMALQLALLADKLSASPEASAASAGHLGALREQIGRVNEVVRRFLDVTDPSAPLGYTDLGILVGDLASLFGHDARRRRIALEVDAPRGTVRTGCEAGRVGRLVLSLFARALATTPEGGRLAIHVEAAPDGPTIWLQRTAGAGTPPATDLDVDLIAAGAEALGGALELGRSGEAERVVLRLPRNQAS